LKRRLSCSKWSDDQEALLFSRDATSTDFVGCKDGMEVHDQLVRSSEQLDLVTLLRENRAGRQRLADIPPHFTPSSEAPDVESFLRSLRIAWTEGEVRPIAELKPKLKRDGRRTDPLFNVTNHLYRWFEDEPWRMAESCWSDFRAFIPLSIQMD
jgi:hypothetical protein